MPSWHSAVKGTVVTHDVLKHVSSVISVFLSKGVKVGSTIDAYWGSLSRLCDLSFL